MDEAACTAERLVIQEASSLLPCHFIRLVLCARSTPALPRAKRLQGGQHEQRQGKSGRSAGEADTRKGASLDRRFEECEALEARPSSMEEVAGKVRR